MYTDCTHQTRAKWQARPKQIRYSRPEKNEISILERMHNYVDRKATSKEPRDLQFVQWNGLTWSHPQGDAFQEVSRLERECAADCSPGPKSLATARRLLHYAAAAALPPARVLPLGDGGVMVRFWRGDRFASIDIFDDGDVVGTSATRGSTESSKVWTLATDADGDVQGEHLAGLLRELLEQLG